MGFVICLEGVQTQSSADYRFEVGFEPAAALGEVGGKAECVGHDAGGYEQESSGENQHAVKNFFAWETALGEVLAEAVEGLGPFPSSQAGTEGAGAENQDDCGYCAQVLADFYQQGQFEDGDQCKEQQQSQKHRLGFLQVLNIAASVVSVELGQFLPCAEL